jgi:transcriptional regulator with XRE-family HTH domain
VIASEPLGGTIAAMDAVRLGLSIRALRRRRRWTQKVLGERIGMSASGISRIERGAAHRVPIRTLERALEALGARLYVRVQWRGEELDRLLDHDHALIVERMLALLALDGWTTIPEATFQVGGERGSIDILAWHEATGTLLVIEVKSVVPDVQATVGGIDRKTRIAPTLARERGWAVTGVGRLLVLPDDRTARRRLDAFRATFDRALPARTVEIKQWLARPSGLLAGVLFLSGLPVAHARHRVRPRRDATTHAAAGDS